MLGQIDMIDPALPMEGGAGEAPKAAPTHTAPALPLQRSCPGPLFSGEPVPYPQPRAANPPEPRGSLL